MTYVTLHISFFVSVLYYSFSLKNEKSFFQSNCVFNIWKFRNKRWAVFWLFRGLFFMTTYNISKTLTKNPTENLTENLSILLSKKPTQKTGLEIWLKNHPKNSAWNSKPKTSASFLLCWFILKIQPFWQILWPTNKRRNGKNMVS